MESCKHSTTASVRPRPAFLRALGRHEPPASVEIAGQAYHLARLFKHDSWAATALYEGEAGQVVCKFNRQKSLLGLPMKWLGRLLASREAAALKTLEGLAGIPRLMVPVHAKGRLLDRAVAHEFVPGHPLGDRERVTDQFFPALSGLLREIHERGLAYVDLHKRENVLVGVDGRPYLIDFQISLRLARRGIGNGPLTRAVLRVFQQSDLYHLRKHVMRCRPDQAALGEQLSKSRPWWIKLHRLIAVPFRTCRRKFLVALGVRAKSGAVASEHFKEDAFQDRAA